MGKTSLAAVPLSPSIGGHPSGLEDAIADVKDRVALIRGAIATSVRFGCCSRLPKAHPVDLDPGETLNFLELIEETLCQAETKLDEILRSQWPAGNKKQKRN